MIIKPGIDELSEDGKYNRYTLCIATAKCARIVTNEYIEQYLRAESMVLNKVTDKTISANIKKELRDDKAVKTAIRRLAARDYIIVDKVTNTSDDNIR